MDKDHLEYKFDVLETSSTGHVDFINKKSSNAIFHPSTMFPAGLPQVFPSLLDEVQTRFLENPERLNIHDFRKTQRIWAPDVDVESLYNLSICPLNNSIQVKRNPTSGELLGFFEERTDVLANSFNMTAKNSCSMLRAPGPPSEVTRGSSTNYPFWPGGMEEETLSVMLKDHSAEIDFEKDFLTCPPGFEKGVAFGESKVSRDKMMTFKELTTLSASANEIGFLSLFCEIHLLDSLEAAPERNQLCILICNNDTMSAIVWCAQRDADCPILYYAHLGSIELT